MSKKPIPFPFSLWSILHLLRLRHTLHKRQVPPCEPCLEFPQAIFSVNMAMSPGLTAYLCTLPFYVKLEVFCYMAHGTGFLLWPFVFSIQHETLGPSVSWLMGDILFMPDFVLRWQSTGLSYGNRLPKCCQFRPGHHWYGKARLYFTRAIHSVLLSFLTLWEAEEDRQTGENGISWVQVVIL